MKRRNLRKGMAMAMATAMAFTTAFGTAPLQVAKAADVPDIGTVSWLGGALKVNVKDGLSGIYVANSSVGSNLKVPASTKYEWIENDGVGDIDDESNTITVDLSWLPSSNQYVFIATDPDDIDTVAKATAAKPASAAEKAKIKVLKVNKAPTLAASYVGAIDPAKKFKNVGITTASAIKLSEGYFVLAMKPATGSAFQALTKDEVERVESTDGLVDGCLEENDTDGFAVKGKTFKLSYAPNWVKGATLTDASTATDKVLELNRPSKEINAKLPAKKGAPSAAKADYKKDIVKLPKGAEYTVKVGTGNESAWTKVEGTKTIEKKIAELAPNAEEVGATIKVRTAATATAPSSKVKVIKVKPETTTTGASIQGTTDVLVTSKGAFGISFKTAYDAKSGIVLTNYTSDKYDYALVSKADLKGTISDGILKKDANVDWSKISWKQVAAPSATAAAGKSATINKSTYVKDGKLKVDDYVILYRNVGDGKYTKRAQINAVELKEVKTLVQKMTLTPAGKTAVEITSGAAVGIQKYTALTTGGAIGTIKIDKPITIKKASDKYSITTGVYGEKQCTNSKVGLNLKVTKTHDGVELAVDDSARKKSTAGTYYVKIIIEGSVGVIEVEVK